MRQGDTHLNPLSISANCLIENLTEIDSLPHLRNLTEISLRIDRRENKGEIDDERKKISREGDGSALAPGEQEAERCDARRVYRAHWLQPTLCNRAIVN